MFYFLFIILPTPFLFSPKAHQFFLTLSVTPAYHIPLSNKLPSKLVYSTLLKQVQHQKTFSHKKQPRTFQSTRSFRLFLFNFNPVRHTAHPSPAHTTRCCNFRLSLRWQYAKTNCLFWHRANV